MVDVALVVRHVHDFALRLITDHDHPIELGGECERYGIEGCDAALGAGGELKRVINVAGLGVGGDTMLLPDTAPDPVELEIDGAQMANNGVANRMEMLELELRLAQDLSTIEFSKNQALPNFVLDFQYTVNGVGGNFNEAINTLSESRFRDWSLAGRFDVPLGNEAAEARVHQAILRRLQRLSSKAAREQRIRQEVYDSLDGLQASWQRILAARQSVILAERTLRAEENQFRVGARTSTEVLDAATRLADAQASEIRALTDYQIAQVELAFATGTLLGASKVRWQPRDPRGPEDYVGEESYSAVSSSSSGGPNGGG